MQTDHLGELNRQLYPYNSAHQEAIEDFFGDALLRPLSAAEREHLASCKLFLVGFSNRSGSTLLTELMHQVGMPVPPRAEVFNGEEVTLVSQRDSYATFTDFFLSLVNNWLSDGQAGFKIGARQLFWLTRTGLLEHFHSVRLITPRRSDRLSQAVSLYIARQTGIWTEVKSDAPQPSREVGYSREGLVQALQTIAVTHYLFDYYCDLHCPPRLEVEYESLLQDPQHEMSRVAGFLGYQGAESARADLDAVQIRQQRNELNARLGERFRTEFQWG